MADEKLDTLVRQEQIAEAALSLVAAHGVRRLSMAAVARRVGLVPVGHLPALQEQRRDARRPCST